MDEVTDELGTVRWWGASWGAPINDPRAMVPTPIHEKCSYCDQPIRQGERGITVPHVPFPPDARTTSSWHLPCWMRTIGGQVAVEALRDRD